MLILVEAYKRPANNSFQKLQDKNRILPFPHGLHHAVRTGSTSVLLVASVLDSVVVCSRCNLMPVALAEGTVFLPPDHLPFFEPFEKLSFWFPRDVAAFESVRAFAKKLDERKCSAVTRDVDNPSRKVSIVMAPVALFHS